MNKAHKITPSVGDVPFDKDPSAKLTTPVFDHIINIRTHQPVGFGLIIGATKLNHEIS